MKQPIQLEARIVQPEPVELRAYGWPATYKRLDVYAVGKWRSMGYFRFESQYEVLKKEATHRIALNTGTTEDQLTINFPDFM